MIKRVLIVDDNSNNLYMLESLLKGYGLEVTSAKNGKEALNKALLYPPDLIITDILMPVMDGYSLCRQWKSDEQLQHIPFVFYTATYTEAGDEDFALSLGADRFIVKPQEPQLLMNILKKVLEERGTGKEAATKPLGEEMEFFRRYNEVLFRKLEKKMLDLEAVNKELKLLEERYRLIFENSTDMIVTIDPNLCLSSVSPSIERILGYKPQDFISRAVTDLGHILSSESMEQALHEIRSILKGETIQAKIYPVIAQNGTIVHLEISGSPIRRDDQVIGLIFVARDITQRRQAEAALRESEEKLERIINSVQDVIYSVDGQTEEFTFLSPAFESLLGYTIADIRRMGGRRSFMAKVIQENQSDLQNAEFTRLRSRKRLDAPGWEAWWQCKNGKRICLEDRSIALYDGERLLGTQGILRDITERKQAEAERDKLQEQLWASQKIEAIGRLAGGVAHDFNNLLSVILSYAGFVIDDLSEGHPMYKDLLEIKKAGERAAALTRQLLAFSRKQVLEPKLLDLNQAMAGIQKMLHRLIGEDIELAMIPAPGLGLTLADPGQIEQVIMNLAVNARDAMPQGGQLTLKTAEVQLDEEYASIHVGAKPGHYILLSVSDTGCGMDKQTQAQIFEPFFTTKEKGKGTGLGLSTVYGIVKQSGGNILVYSEPGFGTTFKIYFPREVSDAASEPAIPVIEPKFEGKETILIVEDDDLVRNITHRMLEAAGYTTLTAAAGNEALQISAGHPGKIHMVLTDVVMPQMSGRELTERLALVRPDIKMLYTSGYTDEVIIHHGVLGAESHFISKPFTAADLTRKIRQVLDETIPERAH